MSTRTLAYWLALVDRLVERGFAATLEEHGVTRPQWRVLTVLADRPSTADELAAALAELPPDELDGTLAEQLAELVDSGWVSAGEPHRLTERGEIATGHLVEAVAELRARVLADIDPDEEAATIGVLERIARNLGWDTPV